MPFNDISGSISMKMIPNKPDDGRPSWDEVFMRLAFTVAARATCDRRSVGCILVRDNRVLSTGYNGAPSGAPHCNQNNHGWPEDEEVVSCRAAIHAEANAIATAAYFGSTIEGATAYITDQPCRNCYGMLVNAGVKNVVSAREYKKGPDYDLIPVRQLDEPEGGWSEYMPH